MSVAAALSKSFEQHLHDTQFTRTQRKVWILSAMGVMLDGFDFFIIGVALPLIARDFQMHAATRGLVAVAAVAGALLGALVFGQAADCIGRKGMFLVWMLAFGVLPAVVVVLMRDGLPESVRWHLARGHYEKASHAASQLLETPITLNAENSPPPADAGLGFGSLFSPKYIRRTIFASVPWFLQDISTYGIGIFTPTIMGALALGTTTSFIARDIGATEGAAAVDVLLIVGFMLAIILVHYVSRITLQILGFLGMALGLLMVGVAGMFPAHSDGRMGMIFGGFMVFNALMNMGPNSTTYLLSAETFPTSIRATGAGFATSMAKLGAVLGTFFFPILKAQIGIPALLGWLAGASLLAAIVTYVFRVETRSSLDGERSAVHKRLTPSLQSA